MYLRKFFFSLQTVLIFVFLVLGRNSEDISEKRRKFELSKKLGCAGIIAGVILFVTVITIFVLLFVLGFQALISLSEVVNKSNENDF